MKYLHNNTAYEQLQWAVVVITKTERWRISSHRTVTLPRSQLYVFRKSVTMCNCTVRTLKNPDLKWLFSLSQKFRTFAELLLITGN